MTIDEAITILDALGLTVGMFIADSGEYKKAIGMGMVALEKQTRKKVIPIKPNGYYQCPVCGAEHYIGGSARYCNLCGQRLEWPEDEEADT